MAQEAPQSESVHRSSGIRSTLRESVHTGGLLFPAKSLPGNDHVTRLNVMLTASRDTMRLKGDQNNHLHGNFICFLTSLLNPGNVARNPLSADMFLL